MHTTFLRRIGMFIGIGLMLVLSCIGTAHAADPKDGDKNSKDSAAEMTVNTVGTPQAHTADKPIQVGTIVQLGDKGTDKVKPATSDKPGSMYGVVVDERKLSVTITTSDQPNQAFVAATGTYPVLVSSQNGPITTGDYVTVSSVEGIGMKAEPEQKIVFGRAVSSFDGKNNAIGSVNLKTTDGKDSGKAVIGVVSVVIDIRRNPNEKSTKADLPKLLQRIGEAIAEKPVGPLRIYLSIAITGISIIAAIVILYGGVRSSLISIGRNPLSRKSIFRALFEIILTSLIILIVGLFAVYLLLKL